MKPIRYIVAAVALAIVATPGYAYAQAVNRKVRAYDLASYNLNLNVTPGGTAYVTNAGLTVRRMTTAQRDAISCGATSEGQIVYNSSTDALNICANSAWAAITSGGGGEGLNATYLLGASIDLTNAQGAVSIDDDQTGAGSAIDIDGDGIVAGATSHNYVDIATAVAHTTTGTVRALNADFTGGTIAAGAFEGLQVTMAANTQAALDIPVGAVVLTNGGLTLTSGNVTHTAGDYTFSDGRIVLTEATDQTAVSVTANAATTNDAMLLTANGLTTGDAIQVVTTDAGFTTGCYFRANDGSDVFSVCDEGLTTIGGVASGTDALVLTAGDLLLTSGHIDMTIGNLTLTDGNITVTAGTTSLTNDNTAEAELAITCAGAMTEDCIQLNVTSTGNVPIYDINYSGANTNAAAQLWDVDVTGAGAAFNVLDIDIGAIAYAANIIDVSLGATATAASAIVAGGGAAARSQAVARFNDAGTGTGNTVEIVSTGTQSGDMLQISPTGVVTGDLLDLNFGAAGTGNALQIRMLSADVAAGAINITNSTSRAFSDALIEVGTGTGVFTDDVYETTVAGAGSGHVFNTVVSAAHTGDVFNVSYSAAATGEVFDVSMTNAAADAGVIAINDGARATTVDLVAVTDSGTSTADSLAIAKTGAGSTGSAAELTSTVVAADAGDGKILQVSYNGALVSQGGGGASTSATSVAVIESITTGWADDADNTPSYTLKVFNSAAGAATDNDFALHVDSDGANFGAAHFETGAVRIDGATTVGVSGTGANLTNNLAAGGRLLVDAATVTHTGTDGALDINHLTGTASSAAVSVTHQINANVDGADAVQVTLDTSPIAGGSGIVSPNTAAALAIAVTGNNDAAETGSLWGISIGPPTTVHANTTAVAISVESGWDLDLASLDATLDIGEINTAGAASGITITGAAGVTAGAGGPITITGGAGTAGAGGAVTISAGAGDAANAGGILTLRAGTNAAGGTEANIVFRISDDASGFEDAMVISAGTTPPVQVANSARPTKSDSIPGCAFAPNGTGTAACGTVNSLGGMLFDGLALEQACALWPVPYDIDTSANIDVDFVWNGAAGNGMFRILTVCGGDSTAINAPTQLAASAAFASEGATDITIDDAGGDIAAGPSFGQYCQICFERDGAAGGDTINGVDVALMRVTFNYTSITP